MNSVQIDKALRKDEKIRDFWVGVFAADKLPEKEYPGAYVANTQSSDQGGEHWVAFFTPEQGRVEAFDSYGRNPTFHSEYFQLWIGEDNLKYNHEQFQSYNTTVCGQYCIFFVALRCRNVSLENICKILNIYKGKSDDFVCKFVNKNYNLRTSVQNLDFIKQWSSTN